MENTDFIYTMIGNLIAVYKQGKINDIELYNSIIRLIYNSDNTQKLNLEKTIDWMEENDSPEKMAQAMDSIDNLREQVGEGYVEGLMRIASVDRK